MQRDVIDTAEIPEAGHPVEFEFSDFSDLMGLGS